MNYEEQFPICREHYFGIFNHGNPCELCPVEDVVFIKEEKYPPQIV